MARTSKRQPRTVISISVAVKPDMVRTRRAAGMLGMTVSEYVRGLIRTENARLLDAEREQASDEAAEIAA